MRPASADAQVGESIAVWLDFGRSPVVKLRVPELLHRSLARVSRENDGDKERGSRHSVTISCSSTDSDRAETPSIRAGRQTPALATTRTEDEAALHDVLERDEREVLGTGSVADAEFEGCGVSFSLFSAGRRIGNA